MSDNRSRAERVELVIDTYCASADLDPDDPRQALRCLLADIHHYCFREGIRFDATLQLARETFHEELQRDEP